MTMEAVERAELTQKSNSLRSELKLWEKAFATANGGEKASRDDIKQHPDIASKYKEYNRLRDILSGKLPAPQKENKRQAQTPRKRKREGEHTGAAKRQTIETPSKDFTQPWEIDPYESPSVIRNLFTPSKKVLGPTPQKDGQVLGLFDLLSEHGTPSKPELPSVNLPTSATPRKSNKQDHGGRTPASAKHSLLHPFATPSKNKDGANPGGLTPSSISKLNFATPSFLRRDSQRAHLPSINENASDLSPELVRGPRKPLVRGLSSMLAGLRKMEEDALDEDLEALHEMEDEAAGITRAKPKSQSKISEAPAMLPPGLNRKPNEMEMRANSTLAPQSHTRIPAILVPDSQPGLLPLGGFDDEAMFDSEPEEGHKDEQLRVYKKKGQKRTTRKVNLKPVRSKPCLKAPVTTRDSDGDSDDEFAPPATTQSIPETQLRGEVENGELNNDTYAGNFNSDDSQSEYTASEGGTTRVKRAKKRKGGRVAKGVSKVTALANQNFKRLKLRGKGAKVGGGGRRFGRRR